MAPNTPDLIFGAGLFLKVSESDDVPVYLDILEKGGVKEIDTARIYGESERILGKYDAPKRFIINTKFKGFAPGTLSRESVLAAQKESFEELKVDKVNVYFLHSPDPTTPITETLAAVNEVRDKFKEFGLSNFTPSQVEEVVKISKENGYVLPTVYQGNYNPITRGNEEELFPLLRKLGIRFQAYSPIAGGFLAKDPEVILNNTGTGRWEKDHPYNNIYRRLYNRPKLLEGLRQWHHLAKEEGVSGPELAFRYMYYHSCLTEKGNGLILGASSPEQLKKTLGYFKNGPLSDKALKAIDHVWETVKSEAPINNTDALPKGEEQDKINELQR